MSILVSASASPPAGSLREMLEQYVAMRRRLGYKFQHQGRMLTAFVEYLEQRGETTITVASAMAWVTAPQGASICYQRQRLSAVRGLARHLAAFDPACQIPPACSPRRRRRFPICTHLRRSRPSSMRRAPWRCRCRRPPTRR